MRLTSLWHIINLLCLAQKQCVYFQYYLEYDRFDVFKMYVCHVKKGLTCLIDIFESSICILYISCFSHKKLSSLDFFIRVFWSTDQGFLSQFKGATPDSVIKFKPVSKQPPCINDIR